MKEQSHFTSILLALTVAYRCVVQHARPEIQHFFPENVLQTL
jgi:hypothetical protein